MRSTTYCTREGRKPESRWVPAENVRLGDRIGTLLMAEMDVNPQDAPFAFASCTIAIMGKDAHNDDGQALRDTTNFRGAGRWIHTRMLCGSQPSGNFRKAPNGRLAWSESFAGANDVLLCFGLSMTDVLDHFGNVEDDERKIFDLPTILRELAPDLIMETPAAAAVAAA